MNYDAIAARILATSGRYDLQDADGNDNGLLEYVNRGQRLLDRKANISQLTARNFSGIKVGDYCVKVTDCRVIESVWLLPLVEGEVRVPLVRTDWETMQTRYGLTIEAREKGTPTDYALGSFRGNPDPKLSLIANLDVFAGFMDVCGDNDWDINGFFFEPIADKSYTLQIVGKFYTAKFGTYNIRGAEREITDTFWSEHHPELLEIAARYWMEVDNRNSEGRKDWLTVMEDMLVDLDFESVERDTNDTLVMGEELL